MATFTHKCPHCLTDHIALRVIAGTPIDSWDKAAVYLRCPKCRFPSAAMLQTHNSTVAGPNEWVSVNYDIADEWTVVSFWPEVPGPNIPGHLPQPTERALLQAERNFTIDGNEEAAGTMYRKALDSGLKQIDPEIKGTLERRIDKMVEMHRLTPALGEWAHQIRVLGNESAHDEEQPTREDITALRSFTNLALQYLFTLPKMVELQRKATVQIETVQG